MFRAEEIENEDGGCVYIGQSKEKLYTNIYTVVVATTGSLGAYFLLLLLLVVVVIVVVLKLLLLLLLSLCIYARSAEPWLNPYSSLYGSPFVVVVFFYVFIFLSYILFLSLDFFLLFSYVFGGKKYLAV